MSPRAQAPSIRVRCTRAGAQLHSGNAASLHPAARRGAARRSASRAYAAPGEEMRGRPRRSLPRGRRGAPPDGLGAARVPLDRTPGVASPPARRRLHKRGRGAARRCPAAWSGRGVPPAVSEPRCPPDPAAPPFASASPQPQAAQLGAAQRLGSDSDSAGLRSGAGGCGALGRGLARPERAPERALDSQTAAASAVASASPPPPASAPPSHCPRRRPHARARGRRHDAEGARTHAAPNRAGGTRRTERRGAGAGTGSEDAWVGREKQEARRRPTTRPPP